MRQRRDGENQRRTPCADNAPVPLQGHREGLQDDADQRRRDDQTADLVFVATRNEKELSMSIAVVKPQELAKLSKEGRKIDLIDVRTPVEFREVHVEFARNVPLDQLDPAALMQARMPWNGCSQTESTSCTR